MKLCQNDEVLYRLGQSCLSRQGRLERSLDNRLLFWAFSAVLAFLLVCFSGTIFFFFDMVCCVYFMGRAGRERVYAQREEAGIQSEKNEGAKRKGEAVRQGGKEYEDGFFKYAGWLSTLFIGVFVLVFLFQRKEMGFFTVLPEHTALAGALFLLFVKEGACQIANRKQDMYGQSVLFGYRYSQLPTICTLMACLSFYLGQESVVPYMLVTAYLFVMILFCPVFKRNTFL